MAHNKKRNLLLYLLSNCIGVTSGPEVVYFSFLKFNLFNSSGKSLATSKRCWFGVISLLIADISVRAIGQPDDFLSKHL